MIRKIVKTDNQNISIFLPKEYVGKEVEVIAFTIEEMEDKATADSPKTHFASEQILAKDWLTPEEDKAWRNL
jgi:hypothetical protein